MTGLIGNIGMLMRSDYKLSIGVLIFGLFLFFGLGADILADENSFFIPFGPETASESSPIYMPPGHVEKLADGSSKAHILGTDHLGRDVLARMIHGTRLALIVGIASTAISFLIALFLGSIAGYFGDKEIRVNVIDIILGLGGFIFGILLLSYNASSIDPHGQEVYAPLKILLIVVFLGAFLYVLCRWFSVIVPRKRPLPIDSLIVKLLEVFRAIPALFLIIALFSLIQYPSIWTVVFIIGVMRWGTMSRLLRAEIIRLKAENYIVSARLSSFSDWRILIFHIWPNAIGSMIVSACFYVGTAILIEATLSFLGIGVPVTIVSWGNMLSVSRAYLGAWWLAVFPGLGIFLMILSVTIIGDRMRKRLRNGVE